MVDQMVLQAQQWVNATYTAAAGYQRCPEDGRTGWSTMYSLTMALQREIGITTLSTSFGPATLAALTARGGVPYTETNRNIVKIVQSACYCKGYNAGSISGYFDSTTQSAVLGMTANAGLGTSWSQNSPKLMKALLTMDAYVVVSGGSPEVRAVQQWLNGRYLPRRDFFVMPCDGHFSRDVQKNLLMAIQYELGLSDDLATGTFGPTTQNGLRVHTVQQGSTGIWVQLFSAAMVFNDRGRFTGTFDADLAADVADFQGFSALHLTSQADFATWAQLLVSTGDPTRPGNACDCSTTVTAARAAALKAAGYFAVGRYLDQVPGGLDKKIKPGELQTIFDGGLRVFPISQYNGGERGYFTQAQGVADATAAHDAATGYGFAPGTVIYFAVDYDATQEDIDAYVVPYFRGVVAGLASRGKRYLHGVYGSRNVCAEVTRTTLARWSFVSGMSTGFSGNLGFPLPANWAFNQIQTTTAGSGTGAIQIDKDVWQPGTDPGTAVVGGGGDGQIQLFLDSLQQIYDAAVGYGQGDPNLLVMQYLRHRDYDNAQFDQLIGPIDQNWIQYATAHGITHVANMPDPFYGIVIDPAHFGASCNGAYLIPPPPGVAFNRGDVAGWAGDLYTFYGEWRRDSDSIASGYDYCRQRLARIDDTTGTFKLTDLLEDSTAYTIATAVRGGRTIVQAMQDHLLGGYTTRLKRFVQDRLGGTAASVAAFAREALLRADDTVIALGRIYLIETTGGVPTAQPNSLPDSLLDPFCQGFGETLAALVTQEG